MKRFSSLATLLTVSSLVSSQALAAGFEKTFNWGAKAVSQGGAVVGSTSGSEALYFNPAGLVTNSTGGDVTLNFSPTFSQFNGQHAGSNSAPSVDSKSGFSPIIGANVAYQLSEKLGVGIGYYVAGGTKSRYENLDYSGVNANYATLKPLVEADLAVTELAVGGGYEVAPGLKIGAAWRAIFVKANFASTVIGASPTFVLQNLKINDIKDTKLNGFKLGAQYQNADKSWGLGANFRSAVKFTGKGDGGGAAEVGANGSDLTLGSGKVDVSNQFPMQIVLGGFSKLGESSKIALEYSFTNYAQNRRLDLNGSLTGGTAGTVVLDNRDIDQNWKNQHVARIGYECNSMALPLRAGYALTSQVTPDNRARSTFASPGLGHSFAVGTGFAAMDAMEVNFAGEYSFAGGKGTNPNDAITTEKDFTTKAYVLHTGLSYKF